MTLDHSEWYTEKAWLTAVNPHHLLTILCRQGVKSSRKFRLAACACARVSWANLPGQHRQLVVVSEQYADGQVALGELLKAAGETPRKEDRGPRAGARLVSHRQARYALSEGITRTLGVRWSWPEGADDEPTRRFSEILRDVFGNPFRPVDLEPYRTRDAQALATATYEERDWAKMGVLADALEDAGCADDDVLQHCRSGGEHVRGCWVVDAILGRQ